MKNKKNKISSNKKLQMTNQCVVSVKILIVYDCTVLASKLLDIVVQLVNAEIV